MDVVSSTTEEGQRIFKARGYYYEGKGEQD